MKRTLLGAGIAALAAVGVLDLGATPVRAQVPAGSVVYETVAPGTRSVTYGEQVRVRRGLFKTVIRERPVRYVTTTPPVVRETRVIRPAPVIQQQVVQPAPIIEQRVVQPAPIVESRYIQPAPVIQRQVIQGEPVIQTRYLSPY
jgi:hypothetical protein